MKTNFVRAKLKQGESSIGTWLTLADPISAQLMARVGFDWLTVEMEHTPITWESAALSYGLIAGGGSVPLVRVAWNSGENIKRALDTGAWGVVVPMVNSRAQAEAAVAAARFQPLGKRSIGGQLHATSFDTDPGTYYARANEEILLVLMIEHVEAIQALDDILSVPGIDVAFIGPNDLHNSMGQKPMFESDLPQFTDALERVLQTCKKYGVAPGIHVIDANAAQRRIEEGFQFVAIASEAAMMLGKAREIARALGIGGERQVIRY